MLTPDYSSFLFLRRLEGASGALLCINISYHPNVLKHISYAENSPSGTMEAPRRLPAAALPLLTSFSIKLPVSTTAILLSPQGDSFWFRCFVLIVAF